MTSAIDPRPSDLTTELGLDVRPLSGNIGAEIFGVDLTQALAPAVVADIRAALLRWRVIFFRDQHLTQAQHIAFGACFGDVTPAHPTLPAKFPQHPEILLLDNEMSGYGSVAIDNRWHTDVTFVPNPPMGSILRGVVVPPYGGDTQFLNIALAYERLSDPVKAMVDGLRAVHHNSLPIARGEMTSELQSQFQSREIKSVHPVVRVHPETGEKVLFVNPTFTSHILDISRQESRHILAMLYEHMAHPAHTVRFRWQPDSIAFWDNRATCHLGPSDTPAGMTRSMQRITLAGDVPVGPDGFTSYSLLGEAFG